MKAEEIMLNKENIFCTYMIMAVWLIPEKKEEMNLDNMEIVK